MFKQVQTGYVFIIVLVALHATAFAEPPKTAAQMKRMQGSPPKKLIDISKWDKGSDNRWAFQHISEIIPTANISRGSTAPSVLLRAPRNITGFVFENHDDDEMTVKEMLDTTNWFEHVKFEFQIANLNERRKQ